MTINLSDNSPRISYTVAAGVTQSSFTVPFDFFEEGDVNVYVDGVLKTITTDYTVSGGSGTGGTVTMSVTGISGGSSVVITRSIPLERTTDFPTSGPFDVTSLNEELDRITAINADLNDEVGRSLRLTDADAAANLTIPLSRANKVLAFDSNGNVDTTQEIGLFKGNWSASTAYVLRDIVKDTSTNNIFIANTAHTSSGSQPLTTNADSTKWELIVDAASATTSATNAANSATAAATDADDADKIVNTAFETQYTLSNGNTGYSALHYYNATIAQVSNAVTQAGLATNAKTSAEAARAGAEEARDAVFTSLDNFDDRYLGSMADSQTQATAVTDATFTTGTTSMTVASASGIVVGMEVASTGVVIGGSGIPSDTNVIKIDDTTITVNNEFDATRTAMSVTFTGRGILGNFDATKDGPSTDNDGNTLVGGQLYYNTTDAQIKVYNGSNWVAAYVNGADFLPLVGGTVTGAVTIGNITIDTNTISTADTNGDLLLTPNGTGDVIAETDTFTIRNTSDSLLGPNLVLDHTSASPSTTDTNAIFSILANDAGGTEFSPVQMTYQTPDVTSGFPTGKAIIKVKEDGTNSPTTYVTFDGDAEQVTFAKRVVMQATTDIETVNEKVSISTSTSGTATVNTGLYAVVFYASNQTANRTVNFALVNSTLDIGQSVTCAVLLTLGSTPYYLNAYQVDGVSVTPKWQGGTAPSAGNANSIDVYSFTIIKTADATFTVLASQTQFA